MKLLSCIFVDTPQECRHCDLGHCGANSAEKHSCLFNHIHMLVADDAKPGLIAFVTEEVDSPRRYKKQSGLAGRHKG